MAPGAWWMLLTHRKKMYAPIRIASELRTVAYLGMLFRPELELAMVGVRYRASMLDLAITGSVQNSLVTLSRCETRRDDDDVLAPTRNTPPPTSPQSFVQRASIHTCLLAMRLTCESSTETPYRRGKCVRPGAHKVSPSLRPLTGDIVPRKPPDDNGRSYYTSATSCR